MVSQIKTVFHKMLYDIVHQKLEKTMADNVKVLDEMIKVARESLNDPKEPTDKLTTWALAIKAMADGGIDSRTLASLLATAVVRLAGQDPAS